MKKTAKTSHNKELLLLIDGSNLAYRAFHKYTGIRSKDEGPIGLVYGFLKILQSYMIRFDPTQLVVVFDTKESKKSNFRLKLHPDYKGKRRVKLDFDMDDFARQMQILKSILRAMGVQILWDKHGYEHECDDYIAAITLTRKYPIIIVSSDKDFCQLLNKHVKIFNPSKEVIIRDTTCQKIMGYDPHTFKEYLILTGDDSDNIPGYRGIGPVKAKDFFNKFRSLQGFIDDPDAESKFPHATKDGIQYRLDFAKPLIDLEYALSKYPLPTWPQLHHPMNEEKLFSLLKKYSFYSMITDNFINLFKDLKKCKLKQK